ncbi:MAG TPA: universal stress protein [Acidothermaceae bacterium]|jgi:nucleotide-binding universal stress UspA family protein|nr:universal stress protein [Acidothermaceae bacterium]
MKLVVGHLATSGDADAVSLGVRLARALGAELELRMVLAPDDVTTPRVTSDKFHEVLAEQGSEWLDEVVRLVPDDVTARGAVLVEDSVAGGLSTEALRLEAEAIVVGGSGRGLARSLSLGSLVDDLLHFARFPSQWLLNGFGGGLAEVRHTGTGGAECG